jgi:ADP-heptose:LPS heptosyltransferase
MRIKTLLFRRVGDSLLATPALRALKKQYPEALLTVISEPQVARVFAGNPWVDEIVTVPRGPSVLRLAAALRRHGAPDMSMDFLSDPRSALACRISGAEQRLGVGVHGRRWAYTQTIGQQTLSSPRYSAAHKLELAALAGAALTDLSTEFYLTSDDRNFAEAAWQERGWSEMTVVTAFFVHARRDYKRWPLDDFCTVIRRMHEGGDALPLVLVTPGDESTAAELRARTRLDAPHIISVDTLGELGAVLQRCRLFIGNDGGPKHLAVALGTPTVTIFISDSPVYWTPPDTQRHVALSSFTSLPSITPLPAVTADDVYGAALSLLKKSSS